MKISERPIDSIKPADWRANVVLKPDMDLLRMSLSDFGWLQPIVVRAEDSSIIDGFHRWVLSQEDRFVKKFGKNVPCVIVSCDAVDAMLMHVRMNRARGSIFAKPFSTLLKKIVLSNKYSDEELCKLLQMSADEMDLMLSGGLLKQRNIPNHVYSRAWVPIEAPSSEKLESIVIERPPNDDR